MQSVSISLTSDCWTRSFLAASPSALRVGELWEASLLLEENCIFPYHECCVPSVGLGLTNRNQLKTLYSFVKPTTMSCELNTGGGGPGSSRSSSGIQIGSAWFQRRINLRPQHRGVHLVTEEVLRLIPEISQFSVGLAHFQSMFYHSKSFILYILAWHFFPFPQFSTHQPV